MDGWVSGWVDGGMDGWMDGWLDGRGFCWLVATADADITPSGVF